VIRGIDRTAVRNPASDFATIFSIKHPLVAETVSAGPKPTGPKSTGICPIDPARRE
jgi:hypothetical protein